ncbi:MAG: DUF6951 family protein [Armatimonadota bacterium]
MANVSVQAGICGFVTKISAACDEDQAVSFTIVSDCPNIKKLADAMPSVDAYDEIGAGYDGELLSTTRTYCKGCCSACVVPNAIFKAMQVAAGLALPAPIMINLIK